MLEDFLPRIPLVDDLLSVPALEDPLLDEPFWYSGRFCHFLGILESATCINQFSHGSHRILRFTTADTNFIHVTLFSR